ncbi:MAG: ATP-binding protein [Gemmatimonadales bacterium]
MSTGPSHRRQERWGARYRHGQRPASLALIILGLLALTGWVFGVEELTTVIPGGSSMRVDAALCFVLLGVALWLRGRWAEHRWSRILAAVVLGIAVVTLLQYLTGISYGLESLSRAITSAPGSLGGMALPTAVGFAALGAGLLVEDRSQRSPQRAQQLLALLAILVGLLGTLGYIYRTGNFLSLIDRGTSIAVHTVFGLLLGGVAVLFLHPRALVMEVFSQRGLAGSAARQLVFAVTPILLLLVWILRRMELSGYLGGADAAALRDLVLLISFLVLSWRAFRTLGHQEVLNRRTLADLWKAQTTLEAQVAERTAGFAAATERAEAARAQMEENRRLLDWVMEHSPTAIFLKTTSGHYLLGNQLFGRMSQREPDSIPGCTDYDLFPPDVAAGAVVSDQVVCIQSEPHLREVCLTLSDGVEHSFLIAKQLVSDGRGGMMICGVATDVTAHKAAEAALRRSEATLQLALDNAGLGLWHWNIADGQLRSDRNTHLIHGYGEDEEPNNTIEEWVAKLHPSDAAAVEAVLQGHLADPAVSFDVVYRTKHRQGDMIWINSRGRVVERDDAGRPVRMIGTVADISARKAQEALIEARNHELETLIHVISHDLREPLRAVESFSRLVSDRYRDKLDERGTDFLDRIVRATGRMSQLLDDIVALSRARRAEAAPAPISGDVIASEVVSRMQMQIGQSDAQITVLPDLPWVWIDRTWAEQTLSNLLANALKFRRQGVAPDVVLGPWQAPGETGFVVLDRGPGVPKGLEQRIFQLFQRGVGRDVEGTGAGLAIVRQIAERHGGRAWVESREGGGSAFYVSFATPRERSAA